MAMTAGRRRDAWLIFAILIAIQIACFRSSSKLRSHNSAYRSDAVVNHVDTPLAPTSPLWKRSLVYLDNLSSDQPDNSSVSEHKHTHDTSTLHDPHKQTRTTTTSSTTTASTTPATGLPTQSPTPECHPLPLSDSPDELCNHVFRFCEPSGHIDYLRLYYCTGAHPISHRPDGKHPDPPHGHFSIPVLRASCLLLIFAIMLFLFSFVGVVASDFLCPNLSTIASRLGLTENTAGVTFLAFGNGSPDVFSTFGAMRTGSGSLAIGELIGAASFIVSVISGSMMLIAPFRVKPWPFCRDVGFFVLAISMILAFLFDGNLRISECIALICVYVAYAATVIIGGWWQERRRQKRLMIAAARDEYNNATQDAASSRASIRSGSIRSPYPQDIERSQLLSIPSNQNLGAFSPSEYQPDFDPFEDWASNRARQADGAQHFPSRSGTTTPDDRTYAHVVQTPMSGVGRSHPKTPVSYRPGLVPRHSLLSAIEFRDVVQSLRREASADRSMEIFQSWDPERFLPHHHHHNHQHSRPALDTHPNRSANGHFRAVSMGPGVPGTSRMLSPANNDRRRRQSDAHDSSPYGAGGIGERRHSRSMDEISSDAPLINVAASSETFEDPWREHTPGDACEPLSADSSTSPLGSPLARRVGTEELRQSLPKLEIPKWNTAFARHETDDTLTSATIRKSTSIPSIKVNGDQTSSAGQYGDGLVDKPRIRRRRTLWELIVWKVGVAFFALFPTLRHLHAKSWVGAAISIVTSPAILLLNLTLPVVDDGEGGEQDEEPGAVRLEGEEVDLRARALGDEEQDQEAEEERIIQLGTPSGNGSVLSAEERVEAAERLVREENTQRDREIASALRQLPQSGSSPLSLGSNPKRSAAAHDDETNPFDNASVGLASEYCSPEEEAEEEELRRSSNRFLILCQCAFAPVFLTWALASTSNADHVGLKMLGAFAFGSLTCACALVAMRRKDTGRVRYSERTTKMISMLRCSLGFLVSVMWIMTIVDEVVSILQTVGLIAGISDAILGLTVFAVGNSLGDLVANVTIARLGHPVMAISACFAGPLLNLLLGIGISGTFLLSGESSKEPWSHTDMDGIYPIDFSPTLLVSGLGLLFILIGTLIAVPLNGFYLTRPLGVSLIAAYIGIMSINVITELFWSRPLG